MKRLILLLFCLFVLVSSSFAWMTLPVVGGGGGELLLGDSDFGSKAQATTNGARCRSF